MTVATLSLFLPVKPRHTWLRQVSVAWVPDYLDPVLETTAAGILAAFARLGHVVQEKPSNETDILLTTAPYGVNVNWRHSLLFTGRARFKLERNPTVFTMTHIRPAELQAMLAHFERALQKPEPDPADFEFDGLSAQAYHVLYEQGTRGGPILALERLIQAQTKSIRVLLVVGEDRPEYVYHFDLVGAYPRSIATDPPEAFYEDIALRLVTTVSTREVTAHEVVGEPIPYAVWRRLETPGAMIRAAKELGRRRFFTEMVRINDLVNVPVVGTSVASQYSEGCFATWDPTIAGLITTITGSARPVDKDNLTEDELSIITGVRPGGIGALVRHVEGKRNDPPSSEAVEMIEMDQDLPRIRLGPEWGSEATVPVVRSKLHGHRGVASYRPDKVEYVPLEEAYFHYIVSCATEAQAHGVRGAFARAESLNHPDDPRPLAFTILPGHGLVLVEKWIPGKAPFQLMWEAMDAGDIVIASHVPQGPMTYEPDGTGSMVLRELS